MCDETVRRSVEAWEMASVRFLLMSMSWSSLTYPEISESAPAPISPRLWAKSVWMLFLTEVAALSVTMGAMAFSFWLL